MAALVEVSSINTSRAGSNMPSAAVRSRRAQLHRFHHTLAQVQRGFGIDHPKNRINAAN